MIRVFGVHIAPEKLIKMSNFCNKIFMGFRSMGSKSLFFPLTLLVIVKHCYMVAQPVIGLLLTLCPEKNVTTFYIITLTISLRL